MLSETMVIVVFSVGFVCVLFFCGGSLVFDGNI